MEREETRFNDYWQSFQEIPREQKANGEQVAARMCQAYREGNQRF